jgi:hypothetical protein
LVEALLVLSVRLWGVSFSSLLLLFLLSIPGFRAVFVCHASASPSLLLSLYSLSLPLSFSLLFGRETGVVGLEVRRGGKEGRWNVVKMLS